MSQARRSFTIKEHPAQKTCHVEQTSCCCILHSTSPQAYSQDSVPKNAAYCQLTTAVSGCFRSLLLCLSDLLCLIWNLETAARKISGGYARPIQVPDEIRSGKFSSC